MPKTLLITDDSLLMRKMIRDAAEEAGWAVVGEATNGQQAIDKYIQLNPHLVTLDLMMPEYDGIHALTGIREFDRDATVIMVSAIDQADILKETFKKGAADFVVKPFKQDELVSLLEAHAPSQSS